MHVPCARSTGERGNKGCFPSRGLIVPWCAFRVIAVACIGTMFLRRVARSVVRDRYDERASDLHWDCRKEGLVAGSSLILVRIQ